MEKWKVIEFANTYEVSNLGRIRNRITKKMLKPFANKTHPTLRVTLMRHGSNEKHSVSQIVFNHWCLRDGDRATYYWFNGWKVKNNRIGHLDGDKTNNKANNLYRY
jgi:hypothetical protein